MPDNDAKELRQPHPQLRIPIVALSSFLAGLVFPQMNWISDAVASWLAAFAIGGWLYWAITSSVATRVLWNRHQSLLRYQTWVIAGLCVAVFFGGVLVINQANARVKSDEVKLSQDTIDQISHVIAEGIGRHQSLQDLKAATDNLSNDLAGFMFIRAAGEPSLRTFTDRSEDATFRWFNASADYAAETARLYTSNNYYRRLVGILRELRDRNIINDIELNNTQFYGEPRYPVLERIVKALEDYSSRIK